MIKITKEVLDYLSIKAVYVIFENSQKFICIPVKLYTDCWRVYIANENSIESEKPVLLEILNKDNTIVNIQCKIRPLNDKYKQYLLFLQKPVNIELWEKIKSLEEQYGAWEKRSGLRLEIGIKNYQKFGLKDYNKQKVVINGFEHSCIVDDVSMNGIRISFVYPKITHSLFDGINIIPSILGVKLLFTNPLFSLFLTLEPARIHFLDKEKGSISVGCRIKEPINIAFINKVTEYARTIEGVSYVLEQSRG